MVPALTSGHAGTSPPADRLGVVYVPHGAVMESWTPTAQGAEFEIHPHPGTVDSVQGPHSGPDRAQQRAGGGAARRTCRRTWTDRGRVSDRRAREADGRGRGRSRSLVRPDRGRPVRGGTPNWRHWNWDWRRPIWREPATSATAVPTSTRSPGGTPPLPCPRRTTRGRFSNASSATTRAPIRPSGSIGSGRNGAFSTRSPGKRPGCKGGSAPATAASWSNTWTRSGTWSGESRSRRPKPAGRRRCWSVPPGSPAASKSTPS